MIIDRFADLTVSIWRLRAQYKKLTADLHGRGLVLRKQRGVWQVNPSFAARLKVQRQLKKAAAKLVAA